MPMPRDAAEQRRLAAVVESWLGRTVLVVGDAMLDEWRFAESDRLCREAPAPVLTLRRRLAAAGTEVTLLARDLQGWVAPGVRGVDLDEDDPLVDEWVVVLPSPDRPAVLAATDLRQPAVDDLDRDFAYATSSDPEVVAACAEQLARVRTA